MALSSDQSILILEVRNTGIRQVSFSALDARSGLFKWRDVCFDESWWISLNAVQGHIALFTVYTQTDNPDKKGIFAYHVSDQKIIWWKNDYSLHDVNGTNVKGYGSKFGNNELFLDLQTGDEIASPVEFKASPTSVIRPHQYAEGLEYFDTVKIFLLSRFNLLPVTALEYMEYDSVIIISLYINEGELTNYLMIISEDGSLLIKEKLDEHLKGIGLDTFFIYDGCVFFVKNKCKLFSYKIV